MKTHTRPTRYVICIRNDDTEDLELRKVYAVIPDMKAQLEGYIRIVDESGEDYLYPEGHFMPIDLPRAIERAIA